MQLQHPCFQSSVTRLSTAFLMCVPIYLKQKCTCFFTLLILLSKDNISHISQVTRDLNLIDYRYFIGERNQREKRFSNTVEIMELSINSNFYSPKVRGGRLFFSFTSNVSVSRKDTFLLPVAVSIQNLSHRLKVIFLYVISYFKLAFAVTN